MNIKRRISLFVQPPGSTRHPLPADSVTPAPRKDQTTADFNVAGGLVWCVFIDPHGGDALASPDRPLGGGGVAGAALRGGADEFKEVFVAGGEARVGKTAAPGHVTAGVAHRSRYRAVMHAAGAAGHAPDVEITGSAKGVIWGAKTPGQAVADACVALSHRRRRVKRRAMDKGANFGKGENRVRPYDQTGGRRYR